MDSIAIEINQYFMDALRRRHPQEPEYFVLLTITSNVVYGQKTGATPMDAKGEPFALAQTHERCRQDGALALNSVAKRLRGVNQDGISNTFTIVPGALGKNMEERVTNLTNIMDGYFGRGAFHLNVNVLDRDLLIDAMEHPEKYPNLTIRVSGYAVRFNRLKRQHQLDVINRTFHEAV